MEKLINHFEIGDYVGVHLHYAGGFGAAKVEAVYRSAKKVTYDLSVQFDKERNLFTRINGVDQLLLMSRQEWMDLHWHLRRNGLDNQHPRSAEEANILGGVSAHTSKEIPYNATEEGSIANYVLIDINGYRNREDFEVGFYNATQKEWCLKYSTKREIDLDHMKWMYLPVNK